MSQATTPENTAGIEAGPIWLEWAVRVLIFLFPVTVATLGGGSIIMMLLLIPALYYGRGWTMLAPWERRLMLGLVAVFVVMSLSLINAEDLREGGKELERYLRFVMLLPIYLMFRRFGYTVGRELALGAVVGAVLMFGQSIYQVMWLHMPHAQGYYHKIVFGDLAVWWAAVTALFATVILRDWTQRLLLLAVILMALYASLLSVTRGAWLFVPVFPAILVWAVWGNVRELRKWLIAAVLAGIALLTLLGTQTEVLREGFLRGINEIELFLRKPDAESSWGIRLNLWRNSLLLAQETPLLGSGVGDFKADMKRMVEDGRSWSPHVAAFGHAHSIYFDTLAKGGVIGLVTTVVVLLLLPFTIFIKALRQTTLPWDRFYALGGVLLIAAYATFGLSEGLWSRNPFVNTYVICLVVFLTGMANCRREGGGAESDS